MSISSKRAKSLLNHDEWTLVEQTLRPKIAEAAEADLRAAGRSLRLLHDKERDLALVAGNVAKKGKQIFDEKRPHRPRIPEAFHSEFNKLHEIFWGM